MYTVTLHGEQLRTDLRVINTGDTAFDFTAALHSYFEVLDISAAKVVGLAGLTYLDKVQLTFINFPSLPHPFLRFPESCSPSLCGMIPRMYDVWYQTLTCALPNVLYSASILVGSVG